MELSITSDGYVKCVATSAEHIMAEQITVINTSNISLPCMKDRYEENVLFYHIGGNVSLAEYIQKNVLDFDKLKNLVINLGNVYEELQSKGLPNTKIVSDIRYIYIEPNSGKISVIQCPIQEYNEPSGFQKIVNSLCYNMKSNNAYIAMGFVLEEVRRPDFNIKKLIIKLEGLKNSTGAPEIQKQIEYQVVEKNVVVNKTSYIACMFIAVILEAIGAIGLPLLFTEVVELDSLIANCISCGVVALLTIIIFVIMKVSTKGVVETSTVQPTSNISTVNEQPMVERNVARVAPRNDARVEKPVRNPAPVRNTPPARVIGADCEETGILQEDVEINPIKRQELYQKNMPLSGCLIEEDTKKRHDISQSTYVVGRSNECDLVLNSTIVSKKHAEIICENGSFYVRDLNSSNNTYLNKATIEPMELYKVENGARIGFGNKWFIFEIG